MHAGWWPHCTPPPCIIRPHCTPPPLHHPHCTSPIASPPLHCTTTPTTRHGHCTWHPRGRRCPPPAPLHRPPCTAPTATQAWSLYLAPERPPLPVAKDFIIVSELQSFANSSGGLFDAPATIRALEVTTLHQYNFRPRDLQRLPQLYSTFEARFQVCMLVPIIVQQLQPLPPPLAVSSKQVPLTWAVCHNG